jgi:NTP pyrophosphatase (non-canonical NTP hydrolase)
VSTGRTFAKAINTYGKSTQLILAIEEMAELTKEICKSMRGEKDKSAFLEEIADVSIMLDQLCFMFDISQDELDTEKEAKLRRLESRMKASYWE